MKTYFFTALLAMMTCSCTRSLGGSQPDSEPVKKAPPAEAGTIRFTVTNTVLHKINANIFGQFLERPSWGETGIEAGIVPGKHTLQPSVRKLLGEMHIPIMRFPGGTDVDYMDWRDMVSNVPGRAEKRPESTGHTGKKVTNYFGFDEFLKLCEELKTDPIVVVNMGDAMMGKKPVKEAARHAAALVAYCNAKQGARLPDGMADWPAVRAANGRKAPWGVPYFQIAMKSG